MDIIRVYSKMISNSTRNLICLQITYFTSSTYMCWSDHNMIWASQFLLLLVRILILSSVNLSIPTYYLPSLFSFIHKNHFCFSRFLINELLCRIYILSFFYKYKPCKVIQLFEAFVLLSLTLEKRNDVEQSHCHHIKKWTLI